MPNSVMIQEQTVTKKQTKLSLFFNRFTKSTLQESSQTEILHNELRNLQKQLEYKEINFIHAEPEYIDVAIMELEAIRLKYSITVRQLKDIVSQKEKLYSGA